MVKKSEYSYGIDSVGQYSGPTVGDAMRAIGANLWSRDDERRRALDSIVDTGIPVSYPISSIARGAVGAMLGQSIAKGMGMGSFWRGLGSVLGAKYGLERK